LERSIGLPIEQVTLHWESGRHIFKLISYLKVKTPSPLRGEGKGEGKISNIFV